MRVKRIANNVSDQTTGADFSGHYLALENVESWTGRIRLPIKPVKPEGLVKRFEPRDVLFGKLRPYLAKVVRPPFGGVCVGEFLVIRPSSPAVGSRFLEVMLRSAPFIHLVNSATFGARMPRADWDDIGGVEIAYPSEYEQDAIASFLAHTDRRINSLIRAKRRLIALLNEQKQAIIHRAVTRGLDRDVRLKPSGIEWLGDVPEHWQVLRSKYVFREVDRRSRTGEETHLSMSQKLGLVPSSSIQEKRLISDSYVGGKLCERGDIVLNRLKAHLGVFALASEPGVISPDYTVLRVNDNALPRYFELVLRTPACRVELRKRAKGIVQGFWRLYTDDLYDIAVPVPPLDEQHGLVEALDEDLRSVGQTMDNAIREIDLVREYRTRLIADVVTGKLDVRGIVLPALLDGGEEEDLELTDEVEAEDEGLADDEERADASD